MNILFLLQYYKVGGVETVTHALSNKFTEEGHQVSIFSFNKEKPEGAILPKLHQSVNLTTIDSSHLSQKEIISTLRRCLIDNRIEIVINQNGHLLNCINLLKKASKGLHIHIISVYHNMPGASSVIPKAQKTIRQRLSEVKAQWQMRRTYQKSDIFVLLSQSFIPLFKKYTLLSNTRKLRCISNPITISTDNFIYNWQKKEKEIIFVGRFDQRQKRLDRIISIWSKLEPKHLDWHLTLIGDGPARSSTEVAAKEMGLKRIQFKGFQNPREYYERAQIIMLTSDYEGFPLILAEAMSFGCVPVAYGSFPAVFDIINSGENGFISLKTNNGFNQTDYIAKLEILMAQSHLLNNMAVNAIRATTNKLSINAIYQQWIGILH